MQTAKSTPSCLSAHFGKTKDGQAVEQYKLSNAHGLAVRVITYGATISGIEAPDINGVMGNIALGFDNLGDYEQKSPYFGATVGRVANRMARGNFVVNGKNYQLAINNGPNTLHGGLEGFDKKIWQLAQAPSADKARLALKLVSPDLDQNFPGRLDVTVQFELDDQNELNIKYTATTDKATPVNLTNHSYFNLAGAGKGTILDHVLTLSASTYTPVDDTLIPTGEILPVEGTAFDFCTAHKIGERINQVPGGYDHNFVADSKDMLARVVDPISGRTLEMTTTEPGVQFYTGNFLDGTISGVGGVYLKNGAFCLEAQHFPDAVHHPNFPSIILEPGQTYSQTTKYKFGVSAI